MATHKITRYRNRKLYDHDTRRYVRLEDVCEMVRRGDDVQVFEHPSGKSILGYTLAMAMSRILDVADTPQLISFMVKAAREIPGECIPTGWR